MRVDIKYHCFSVFIISNSHFVSTLPLNMQPYLDVYVYNSFKKYLYLNPSVFFLCFFTFILISIFSFIWIFSNKITLWAKQIFIGQWLYKKHYAGSTTLKQLELKSDLCNCMAPACFVWWMYNVRIMNMCACMCVYVSKRESLYCW